MASCSRGYVKLANAEEIGWSDILGQCMSKAASFKYGTLGGRRAELSPELVSAFLRDFYDDGKSPGSAPSSSCYWMGSLLVWLTRAKRVKNLANPADAEELDTLPNRDLSCFKTKHFCCRYHDDDTLWRQPLEDKGTNWFLFEQVLKSPLGQRIISHPCSLAALWAIVFLVPMGIGGCESSRSRHVRGFNGAGRAVLPRQRLGTYLLMGPRRLRVRVARPSVYFVPRFWPASENTTEGWRQAVAEAKKQTELDDKNNLAVFVVIGTKFRLLHVTEHSKLPTMKKGPRDPFTFNLERDKNAAGGDTEPPWQHCKRMEP
ncbi:hypothetical protein FOPE_10392 [Fonsecaea pedrosoi]|nr:hypothetical protein FOPE_10392 [Fonsecaea pedrosoi]